MKDGDEDDVVMMMVRVRGDLHCFAVGVFLGEDSVPSCLFLLLNVIKDWFRLVLISLM